MRDEFKRCGDDCFRLMMDDEWLLARNTLEEFLDNHPINFNDEFEYHFFNKPIEERIFYNLFKPEKKIIILTDNYCRLFRQYAEVLMHFDEYLKAKSILKLAMDLNPISISELLIIVQIYEQEYNGRLIEKSLKEALNIVYDHYDLFRVYEELAEYYQQIDEIEISELLFQLCADKSFDNFKRDYVIDLFNRYEIPLGFNPKIVETFRQASTSAHIVGNISDEYNLFYDYWDLAETNLFFEDE